MELAVTGGGRRIIWGASGGTSDTNTENNPQGAVGDNPQSGTPVPSETDQTETEGREYFIPENRSEINIGDNNQPATAVFRIEEMTVAEKDAFIAIPEEELKQVLQDVDTIISSVKVGELSEKSQEALTQVLEKNAISDPTSVKLCKLNFEGHISLDFPVKVSVNIDSSYFTEQDTIYAYHVADNGTVEFLGEAWRYSDNGKVTRIEFMTKFFSDFFVTTQKLVTDDSPLTPAPSQEGNHAFIYIAACAALVLLIVLIIFLFRIRLRNQHS